MSADRPERFADVERWVEEVRRVDAMRRLNTAIATFGHSASAAQLSFDDLLAALPPILAGRYYWRSGLSNARIPFCSRFCASKFGAPEIESGFEGLCALCGQ